MFEFYISEDLREAPQGVDSWLPLAPAQVYALEKFLLENPWLAELFRKWSSSGPRPWFRLVFRTKELLTDPQDFDRISLIPVLRRLL